MRESRIWGGMRAYLKYIWQEKKSIYLMGLLFFPAFIMANFLQVYLPKMVLQELEERRGIWHLGISILVITLILIFSIFLREKMHARIEYRNRLLVQRMQNQYTDKNLYIDYTYLEDPVFQDMRSKTKESLFGGNIGDENVRARLMDFATTILVMVTSLGNIMLYVYYLGELSPWLVLMMIPACFLGAAAGKVTSRHEEKYAGGAAESFKRFDYVSRKTEDFSMAKDVRLYQMQDWFMGLIKRYIGERLFYKKKELTSRAVVDLSGFAGLALQNACLFAYILIRLGQGSITVSDLVFYAGLAPAFSKLVIDFVDKLRMSFQISVEFKRFQEFMDYGENTGARECELQKKPTEIRLEHVSYRYPEGKADVIHDMNLQIHPEEKLAIVGVNGAGKTTLMKLVCGLLHPTEGKIYLNGKDMEEMEAEERYAFFACAFQDVRFLPLTIRDNISMCPKEQTDDERVWKCLEKAGMWKDIHALPERLDTRLDKNINENAVDFSGGQRQKLVLARALYRQAGTLILDEPTAALDALAENDIYEKYAEFASGKTSFFVSHRLSSTHFCDRILLLDGGNVAEEGTHEELLKRGGLYAEMFELQSRYYQTS